MMQKILNSDQDRPLMWSQLRNSARSTFFITSDYFSAQESNHKRKLWLFRKHDQNFELGQK